MALLNIKIEWQLLGFMNLKTNIMVKLNAYSNLIFKIYKSFDKIFKKMIDNLLLKYKIY